MRIVATCSCGATFEISVPSRRRTIGWSWRLSGGRTRICIPVFLLGLVRQRQLTLRRSWTDLEALR